MDQNYLRFLEEDCPLKVNAYLNGKLEELEEYQFGLWELENKSFITKIEAEHVALLIVFPPKLNMRISSLLTTGTMSDITFVVRGTEIHAHKAIVATARSVLEDMFQPDKSKKSLCNKVEIDDNVDPDVFYQLLQFIYTGKASLLEKETVTEPLFVIADKYLVEDLKNACETKLISKITVENVIHFLVLGHLHSAPKLLEASFKVATEHQNEVRKCPEWKNLLENHKDLFYLVSEKMLSNQICSQCDRAVQAEKSCKRSREQFEDENNSEDFADYSADFSADYSA